MYIGRVGKPVEAEICVVEVDGNVTYKIGGGGGERGVVIISWRWGSYQGKGVLILASACLDWRDGKPLLLFDVHIISGGNENGTKCFRENFRRFFPLVHSRHQSPSISSISNHLKI